MNLLEDINSKLMFVLNEFKDFRKMSINFIKRSNYSSDPRLVKQVDDLGNRFATVTTFGKSIAKMLIPDDKQMGEDDQDKHVLPDPQVTTSEENKPQFDLTAPGCSQNQDVGEISNKVLMNKVQDSSATSPIEPTFTEDAADSDPIELDNFVQNLVSNGLHKEAKWFCEETINKIRISSCTKKDNLSIANAMSALTIIYWSTKEYDEILATLSEVLKIRKRELGEDHLIVALTLDNLAAYHVKVGDHLQAYKLGENALKIKIKVLGMYHPEVGKQFYCLGGVYQMTGEYDRAAEFHERALDIFQQQLKPDADQIMNVRSDLARCYTNQGKIKAAKEIYKSINMEN